MAPASIPELDPVVERTRAFALILAGQDPFVGFPCAHQGHIHVPVKYQNELPQELYDIYTQEEWIDFVRRFDKLLDGQSSQ